MTIYNDNCVETGNSTSTNVVESRTIPKENNKKTQYKSANYHKYDGKKVSGLDIFLPNKIGIPSTIEKPLSKYQQLIIRN
jgi:hypothetical protein